MRYYELTSEGKVKGHYAVPQPDKVLHLLAEAPDDESKRDGVPGSTWIPDQEKIDVRLAEAARIAAKAQALVDNLPSWLAVDAAVTGITNLADAKKFIRKLSRIVYWLAKDKAD